MTDTSLPSVSATRHPLLWPLLATLLIIGWSSGFVGIRYANQEASVMLLLFWRTLLSGLILLPFALAIGPRISMRAVRDQALFGIMAVKTGDDTYRIEMAVAGFAQADLDITQERNVLVVKGQKTEAKDGQYLHRGIAGRSFERKFGEDMRRFSVRVCRPSRLLCV